MKTLFTFLACLSLNLMLAHSNGPIKGNGEITTASRSLPVFSDIYLNYGVDMVIDGSQDADIEITIDGNLLPLLTTEVRAGVLYIDQDGWIQPTKEVKITLGKRMLREITSSSHANTQLINFTQEALSIRMEVGQLKLTGQVNTLRVYNQNGSFDGSDCNAKVAIVNSNGWGDTNVNASDQLDADLKDGASLVYGGEPAMINSQVAEDATIITAAMAANEADTPATPNLKLRIQNNSDERIHCVVRGPRGNRFGYGLPFNPGQTRREDWPVGTKLFLKTELGRKLIYTVTEGDDTKRQQLFN